MSDLHPWALACALLHTIQRKGTAMADERHPCDYCGTMLDEDDCVESDIPAVNGPMLHTASQCREYVYAVMTSYKRDRAGIARYLHHVASVEIGSLIGIFGPKAAEVVETVACWVDNRLDEKWADKMRERERAGARGHDV